MVKEYLRLFVKVTRHGTYVDAFAGPQTEEDCTEHWSALQVLESQRLARDKLIKDKQQPHLRNFYLFERSPRQFSRIEDLRRRFHDPPSFNVRTKQGDSNVLLPELLESGAIGHREATFVLLDQRTFECEWKTLERIAASRPSGYKCEIFYLLANSWLNRALANLNDPGTAERWWGRSDWDCLRDLGASDRALWLVERFKNELGYTYSSAWYFMERLQSESSRIHYFMVHASDHRESQKFLDRAYGNLGYPTMVRSPQQANIQELLGEGPETE
ncbi:MAG: three-Cys-motif partner protein TcmP [bacterium]|nr:three-Cys-motif partner protein TcmP [bacterium]